MTHLAISDHDSIESVRYAHDHPLQNGVHLIPATEREFGFVIRPVGN